MVNKPIAKFSAGTLSAAIFKNTTERDGKNVVYHTVALQKRYTDKDGNWKTANSLSINDLPKASMVLDSAYRYLLLKTNGIDTEIIIPESDISVQEAVSEQEIIDELEIGSEVEVVQ